MTYRYFSEDEVKGMSTKLVSLLDSAREVAGIPFIINSGLRTPDKNKAVNGSPTSSHLTGLAVDLKVKNSRERYIIVEALLKVGIKRIGIYARHIHADIDYNKPTPSIWLGS